MCCALGLNMESLPVSVGERRSVLSVRNAIGDATQGHTFLCVSFSSTYSLSSYFPSPLSSPLSSCRTLPGSLSLCLNQPPSAVTLNLLATLFFLLLLLYIHCFLVFSLYSSNSYSPLSSTCGPLCVHAGCLHISIRALAVLKPSPSSLPMSSWLLPAKH